MTSDKLKQANDLQTKLETAQKELTEIQGLQNSPSISLTSANSNIILPDNYKQIVLQALLTYATNNVANLQTQFNSL